MIILIRPLVSGTVMGVLNFLWLGFIAKNLYANELGEILLEKPNMLAAIVFYIIYVAGVVFLAVGPALESGSFCPAISYGALLGLVAYATYNPTNLAKIIGPLSISF